MRMKKEKREEMRRNIIKFLSEVDGNIATIPMLAKATNISPPTAKSIVVELMEEGKVKTVMLGNECVVKLEKEVSKDG